MSAQYLTTTGRKVELVLDDEDFLGIPLYESEDPVRDLLNLTNFTDDLSIFYAVHNPEANLWGFCSVPRSRRVTRISYKNFGANNESVKLREDN